MTKKDEEVLSQVVRWCDVGFATYDPSYYARIDEVLAGIEQTDAVVNARRLAGAGPTLVSPRFAYPHIASALRARAT